MGLVGVLYMLEQTLMATSRILAVSRYIHAACQSYPKIPFVSSVLQLLLLPFGKGPPADSVLMVPKKCDARLHQRSTPLSANIV